MKFLSFTLLFILCSVHFASAQVWKTAEQKRAINIEADIKKRILTNERDKAAVKDAELKKIYDERIAILKGNLENVTKYRAKIEAGDKVNSLRYYELCNVVLRKTEHMQILVTIRVTEAAYETFGGEVKDEMLKINKDIRQKNYDSLVMYDDAIKSIEASIK